MSNLVISVLAYLIDKVFGEFKFIKHPIIFVGDLISFFEKKFYKDSILRGLFLVLFILFSVALLSTSIFYLLSLLPFYINIIFTSILASMFIAHKMLHDVVKDILSADNKKEAISMLVSRDTKDMSPSDINKAAIETYAENLSDGVIAPVFYLLLFNLPGIILYKAINTMDSMVGYRNEKYENYGKVAAILDDIVNYLPSRLTAVLIMLVSSKKNIFSFYKDGKKHESPNAGHPITAMALALDIKLGGDTSYFGKIKSKPYFGEGRKEIQDEDVLRALDLLKPF
ncbi:cobalamin biosynthesis protein CobD [Sulfurimonas sp. MAG313]|nr:adenosylcobinamide-phosphate synthase CbiB [Sulfurimonas sp. MAG313]MDF1882164.1 cobalamin biosynthesis protein CobD [Sulfurimonas sp. MAG313]